MKPNPYFKNEKEQQDLIAKRDAFRFTEPQGAPKAVILIAGREGSGKTHLACTMAELGPVYLIDTEYRAQIVTKKFNNVKTAVVKSFMEMAVAVKHILKQQQPGTIVIDSGSDLQTFAEIEYLERTEKEKVGMPWNWAEVWRLCNAVIDDIKASQQFNLVITARMKEEYVGDKPTGQMIPRVYSTLPYKADLVLLFSNEKERKIVLTKNGYTGDASVPVPAGLTLPRIITQLSSGTLSTAQAVVTRTTQLRKAS